MKKCKKRHSFSNTLYFSFIVIFFVANYPLFGCDILKLSTQGQRWACCEIEKIYISPNRSEAGAVIIEGENKLGHTGYGNPTSRSGYGCWGFFGGNQDGGVPSSVWYDIYGVKGEQYIKIRYCKDGEPESSIRVAINGVDQGISFTPQNLNPNPPEEDWGEGWFRFATSAWYKVTFPDSCKFSLTKNTIDNPVPAKGGTYVFEVKKDGDCENSDLKLTKSPSWVTISSLDLSSVKSYQVTVARNENDNSSRTGTIELYDECSFGTPITITVNQRGPCNLKINGLNSMTKISPKAYNKNFSVHPDGDCTDIDWYTDKSGRDEDRLSAQNINNNQINIRVQENDDETRRYFNLKLREDVSENTVLSPTYYFEQYGICKFIVPTQIILLDENAYSMGYTFSFEGDCSESWEVKGDGYLTTTSYYPDKALSFSVPALDENLDEKTSKFTLSTHETEYCSAAEQIVVVKQVRKGNDEKKRQVVIDYIKDILKNIIPSPGMNFPVPVKFEPVTSLFKTSNDSVQNTWQFYYPDWVKIIPDTGTGDAVVKLLILPNHNLQREGIISFHATGVINSPLEFQVTQMGDSTSLNCLTLTTAGQPEGVLNLKRMWLAGSKQKNNSLLIDGSKPTFHNSGYKHELDKICYWASFGIDSSGILLYDSLNVNNPYYLKIEYSKTTSSTEPVKISINENQAVIFDPQETDNPDTFIESEWILLDDVVPVELLFFKAQTNKDHIILQWETNSESNNYGFEIERKAGNEDWRTIAFIQGCGTTNQTSKYSYTDNDIKNKKYQYRLKQIDNDGSFCICGFTSININQPLEYQITQNYPNPFNKTTKIKYKLSKASLVTIKIYNINGHKVRDDIKLFQESGEYEHIINLDNLPSGIYFTHFETDDYSSMIKMLYVK